MVWTITYFVLLFRLNFILRPSDQKKRAQNVFLARLQFKQKTKSFEKRKKTEKKIELACGKPNSIWQIFIIQSYWNAIQMAYIKISAAIQASWCTFPVSFCVFLYILIYYFLALVFIKLSNNFRYFQVYLYIYIKKCFFVCHCRRTQHICA